MPVAGRISRVEDGSISNAKLVNDSVLVDNDSVLCRNGTN